MDKPEINLVVEETRFSSTSELEGQNFSNLMTFSGGLPQKLDDLSVYKGKSSGEEDLPIDMVRFFDFSIFFFDS